MIGFVGIAVTFAMVFGGYMAAGGKMGIILASLPFEMMMIGGAAVGAFLLSNDMASVKHTIGDVGKVFKGPKWKPQDYRDLLCLLFELIRVGRNNPMDLEQHVESPQESAIFARYPRIQSDGGAVDLICDTLRAGSMNYDDPHQVEEVLEKQLETRKHHAMHSSHALQNVADALPALGIVAAVLGVIKTMAAIDQPPAVLGGMIGGALVGTFLGVFLAYGFVGPMAARVKGVLEEDHTFYLLIREVLVAALHNHSPDICVEVGRQNTPRGLRPSFSDLSDALREAKVA
ncbi:MAG: flagellar motor stator protein MotA [Rhodobacteraceae bacterium]|nr:flagellar motor stator protein MotA [Paracoccaceae bacterium]MBR28328.1 flagellar motor stator protein MotA [Paracoccaceae bacterium]